MIADAPPAGAPPWLVRLYKMGARRPGESEPQFMARRGRASEARWAAQDAGIAAAKAGRAARGEPEPYSGAPYYGVGGHLSASEYAASGIQGSPRRGPGWMS